MLLPGTNPLVSNGFITRYLKVLHALLLQKENIFLLITTFEVSMNNRAGPKKDWRDDSRLEQIIKERFQPVSKLKPWGDLLISQAHLTGCR